MVGENQMHKMAFLRQKPVVLKPMDFFQEI